MSKSEDLEQHRLPWESAEQWGLRETFLRRNLDAVSLDRLLCISQVFINTEFLGCSYDERVMAEMRQLSAGITDSYRAKRKQVIEKVFVSDESTPAAKRSRSGIDPNAYHSTRTEFQSRWPNYKNDRGGGGGPPRRGMDRRGGGGGYNNRGTWDRPTAHWF